MTTTTRTAKADPCDETHQRHSYGPDDTCIRCGTSRKGAATQRAPKRSAPLSRTRALQSISLLITGVQAVAVALAPELEEDALSPLEVGMLADALADEVDASPRLKKWVSRLQADSRHAKLIITVVLLVVPRLVRRGILPDGAGELVSGAVAMAAGPTSSGDRGDGEREVNPDLSPLAVANPLRGVQNETRRRSVSSSDRDEDGGNSEESEVRPNRAAATV